MAKHTDDAVDAWAAAMREAASKDVVARMRAKIALFSHDRMTDAEKVRWLEEFRVLTNEATSYRDTEGTL
jgi:hypothetical protein